MTNERLRAAITAAGYDYVRFAATLGVDPKTVERWISGRVPHRSHRLAAASELGRSDGYLWPSTYNDSGSQSATEAELIKLYPSRGAVPIELWLDLLTHARESIDILVYAGSFLYDSIPGFVDGLHDKATSGIQVRIMIGNPACDAVVLRGKEEEIGDSMGARCQLSLKYFQQVSIPGIQVATHATTLYASIFRFDQAALVNPHIYGLPATKAPMMQIMKVTGGRLFDQYSESIERVWEVSAPVT